MQRMTCHNGFARLGDSAGRGGCLAGENSSTELWSVVCNCLCGWPGGGTGG